MQISSSDFVTIRSFLAGNVETMLENLIARRESSKIDSEDLFGDAVDTSQSTMQWQKHYHQLHRLEVLLAEKDSLGLYVSGNPLQEYQNLVQTVRDLAGRDDIYLIILEKAKKIFTKNGTMMFALQVSLADTEVEGIIFPKNAMRLSSLLEERQLYWVKGNITERSKNKKKDLNEDSTEVVDVYEGTPEYVELPKLAIEEVARFEEGILPLFEAEEIKLAANRAEALQNIDWIKLRFEPSSKSAMNCSLRKITPTKSRQAIDSEEKDKSETKLLQIPSSLGKDKLAELKGFLQKQPGDFLTLVKLEIADSQGNWKRVKGDFWVDFRNLPHEFRQFVT